MINSVWHALLVSSAASSLAILIIALLRWPIKRIAGAVASYWLWLLLPTMTLAVLLPVPSHSTPWLKYATPHLPDNALPAAVVEIAVPNASALLTPILLGIWSVGAVLMIAVSAHRQRAFANSLGVLTPAPDGSFRSSTVIAPMVIGAWRPRLVVPANFEARYGPEERSLMLAHERTHLARGDAAINAIAAAWLCVAWCNPLMYWALRRFRSDQEIACDALVVASSPRERRRYAKALLKAQQIADSRHPVVFGCSWESGHPLKERVAMLKYPSPSRTRRACGTALVIALAASASYSVWAAQAETAGSAAAGTPIALTMRWWVNDVDQLPTQNQDMRIVAGKEFSRTVTMVPGQTNETRCVASLSSTGNSSPVWQAFKATGKPLAGFILLECQLSNNGAVFSRPAIMVSDGKPGTIETVSPNGSVHFKLEFNASISDQRTAAAH